MTSSSFDVVVIGAGIIGAAIGCELGRAGRRVLNVDKLPAAGYGSTSNSCAIIRTYYSTLDGCALAYEAYHDWHRWAEYLDCEDESGLAQFVACGSLVMQTQGNAYLEPILRLADQLGIEYERWDREAILRRVPAWDLRSFGPAKPLDDTQFGLAVEGQVEGAIFWPQSGYINDPQLATHNLQRAAEAAGGEFRFNAEVVEIRRADNRVCGITLLGGEQIDAPVVVNVAGPHSALINDIAGVSAGMRIKTRALRHEVPHLPSPTDFDYGKVGLVTSDNDVGCYTRPASGGHILIGSEDPECDERQWVNPDHFNRELSEQSRLQAMRYAQRLPSMGIPNRIAGVVDLYDVSDDWIPIYDRTDLAGFYVAIGTSGNQFKNAPVVGKLMSALIAACEGGHDHDRDPLEFQLEAIGQSVSLGFYSRNRAINEASSFSVLG